MMTQLYQDQEQPIAKAIEKLVSEVLSETVLRKALLLAGVRGWGHQQTLQLLATVSGPLDLLQFGLLGLMSPERCGALDAALREEAKLLQAGTISSKVDRFACGSLPDLRVYALLHKPLAVEFGDLVDILGPETSAKRLLQFAGSLRLACLVN